MKKIAIIGAGLTGMTIARKLSPYFHVTVFEKSRGIGGRMATKRMDGFEFDHGAQFFTAKSTSFKQFVTELMDEGIIYHWNARFVELDGNEIQNEKIWDCSFPHYVGSPRMNDLCKYLAKNVNVRLNIRIKDIIQDNSWRLVDENDQDLGIYEWVIVTAPAEQTYQLMPSSFRFNDTLASIKMLGCYSLMLGFEQVQLFPFDAAMVHHADISWISVNSSKPNRPNHTTLLAHSTNLWAEANMDRDEEFVIQHLSQELRQAIGLDTSQAKCQVLQRWRYANIGKQPYQEGFIDVDQKLVACGDWCIQGRVESAFLVGENVANQIIREREL